MTQRANKKKQKVQRKKNEIEIPRQNKIVKS